MKTVEKGGKDSDLVIVGSVHGDEPAGKRTIEKILEEDIEFKKPVKFIIANQRALNQNKRYLDLDLNSSFPGSEDSEKYEERLASRITGEIEGKTVLDMHTTQSSKEPFATFKSKDNATLELISDTGVERGICFPSESGVLIEQASNGIIVETGVQGTENAQKDAYRILKNFLKSRGVIEGEYKKSDPEIFEYLETVKGDWEFEAENFEKVNEGEVYASKGDEQLVAQEQFYPVLMSTNGYEGKLGYRARKIER